MAHEASVGWQGKRAKDKTPGGPRMYRVERGKGDRERSQRSQEGRTKQTLVKNNTSKRQPTNTASCCCGPKTAFGNYMPVLFNLARTVSGR